jgi:hypothetical protein
MSEPTEPTEPIDPADVRPFEATEWEAERADATTEHEARAVEIGANQDNQLSTLIETTKVIAANAIAVEKLTKESLIAENKHARRRNRLLTGMVAVLLAITGYMAYRDLYIHTPQRESIFAISQTLEECTTPGPRTPTAEDPSTGHKCFDDGQARTSEAIAQIVDANGNGKLDSQEILDFLKKFEVFLELAPDAEG